MLPLVLIVDPESTFIAHLHALAERIGFVVLAHLTFQGAREALIKAQPTTILANLRLGSFNGIHLAYLARERNPATRTMVYAAHHDPVLAVEVQRAGAFYERQSFVPYSMRRFLTASLPAHDRRNVETLDRRAVYRGGRRTTDLMVLPDGAGLPG